VAADSTVVEGGDSAMTGTFCTICTALLFGLAAPSFAQERFDSPEAAATAIIGAADNHDTARLSAILGPQAKGILTSGDATQDTSEQTEFSKLARTKMTHKLKKNDK